MRTFAFASAIVAASAKPNIVELAESVKDLSTLVSAVVAADLADTLSSPGPFTVFAPTNEGFGALPAGVVDSLMKPENKAQLADILTYHVLPSKVLAGDLDLFQAVKTVEGKNLHVQKWGGAVRVGSSLESKDLKSVTAADNLASNGVVHIIDGVMLPPSSPSPAKPNIVELAQSVKDLSTLVTAVVAADLADTLSSPGPFTVFAPTNEGFAALPAGTVESLLKPENKAQLADLLTYHVLPEQVLSKDLKSFQRVKTVEGKNVHVFKSGGKVHVGPSSHDLKQVTAADNLASNGVVHIINGVLLPPSKLEASAEPNIVELAESVKDLSTLVSAVVAADLADTLSSAGPFTVFAPTNEGFSALPAGVVDSLMKPENKAQLADILTYHVLDSKVLAGDLDLFQAVKTVEGKNLHVQKWGGAVRVGSSLESKDLKRVTAADNLASNGVVHIIDGVMLPPSKLEASAKPNIVELAESVKDLSTLVSAVVAADLADTLSSPGPFTVFAPTNEGFAALPAGVVDSLMKPENKAQLADILTYHVLDSKVLAGDLDLFQAVKTVEGKNLHVQKWGGAVRVGSSLESKDLKSVTAADNLASNGVVHIIDGVMLPPSSLEASAKPNIVKLAESVKDLSTLVAAVVAADLADTLSSAGPFTVFAPTNEAFAALPASVLNNLMKPENKAVLADVLTYHVLPEQVLSKQLKASQTVKTVEGKDLAITKDHRGVIVGNQKVSAADNLASNGVVHIIDGVLSVPQLPNIVKLAESVKDLSTLVSAVVAADLADTLSSAGPFTVFAPTNEGFSALPAGVVDSLMKPENKAQLADILTYHVLPSKVLAGDLDLFQAVKTVEGKNLHVQKWGGAVRVGSSLESKDLKSVTAADNLASNGVVHIIDGVMLPPADAVVV